MCSHWPDYEYTEDEDTDGEDTENEETNVEGTNDEGTANEATSKELWDFLMARDHKPRDVMFFVPKKPILRGAPLYSSFGFNHFVFYGDNHQWVAECEICRESKLIFLEQLGPPIEQGRRSKTFQICMGCMRYRPTRKSFWMAKVDAGQLGETDGLDREKERPAISIYVAKWACGANRTCPTCRHVWLDEDPWYTDGKTPSPSAMTLPSRAQDLPRALRL
ncbi:hypothetical protein HYFRA_00009318 [Hymenoscyphus fraxineus]|uniref:Uncharacterized protein n=1 Tax=Hymenoscyphus fraxineus TaxID=746836 RepID=A0A9N9L4Z8_9HELO|nr:hypothetical protein HYFRA_00009318 [Hymenoscyphus fraxineus]